MEGVRTKLDARLYDLMMDTAGSIAGAMQVMRARTGQQAPAPPMLLQLKSGLAESPGWVLVQMAEFDPEPVTVEKFRVRDIYGAPSLVGALLEIMASEQWLERRGAGEYYLAEEGRAILGRVRERQRILTGMLDAEVGEETEEIFRLLTRIISAAMSSGDVPGTWCLAHSRQRAPAMDSPIMMQIRHYFDDLNAFRDDAHMAAFKKYEKEGYVWEAFSLVCSGMAKTVEDVYATLARRGYSRTEYADALDSLVARSWLARNQHGKLAATQEGEKIRAEVEVSTDAYFYGPWAALSSEDIDRVPLLLERLRDRLVELQ